jgi:hypothetical protein
MKKRSTSIAFVTAMVIAITSFIGPKSIVAAKTVIAVPTSSAPKTAK